MSLILAQINYFTHARILYQSTLCRVRHMWSVLEISELKQYSSDYAITNKLTPFISMQNHYNLVYREEEREMLPTLKVHAIPLR